MKLKLLILVLALQTAWLLGMVATQEYALAHGKAILLETQPVDPRDLLSGDYLMLRYKISDVPTNLFSPPVKKDLPYGTKIFVALAPGTNQFYDRHARQHQRVRAGGERSSTARPKRLRLVERDQFHPCRIRHRTLLRRRGHRQSSAASSRRGPSCPRPATRTSSRSSSTANLMNRR